MLFQEKLSLKIIYINEIWKLELPQIFVALQQLYVCTTMN